MSLARRYSARTFGEAQPAPVLSPLGIPELRSREQALRTRLRERRVRLAHCAAYACCLLLGILTGLWAAKTLTARPSPATVRPSVPLASEPVEISVRTLRLSK